MEVSLEYWHALQTRPVAERHPNLAQPVFRQLVEVRFSRFCFLFLLLSRL